MGALDGRRALVTGGGSGIGATIAAHLVAAGTHVRSAGHLEYPLRAPYAAARWGIEGLTATWAMELGPLGIRVNAVAPGSVEGDRMARVLEGESAATGRSVGDLRRDYEHQVSMRRFITTDEVAAAVVFLCSDGARSINGQVLRVDGNTESLRSSWPDD